MNKTAEQLAGLIRDVDLPKRLTTKLERLQGACNQVIMNWDEFGPDGGLDEYIEGLRKVLKETYHEQD